MASSWKDIQSKDEISELSVSLKNRFGISPHVYVPAIWGGVLLVVLMAVLIVPGIRSPGEQVTITSVPSGAEIMVDTQYRGATPRTMYLAQGTHEIVVTAGTASERIEAQIGRRLVGSLIVPKRRSYTVALRDPDIATTIESGVAEFAQWAVMGEPSAQFQHAPIGHETARKLWASRDLRSVFAEERDELDRFRRDLVAHAGRWQVRDLSAALFRASAPGALPTPGSMSELVQFFVQLDNDSSSFARLVSSLSPPDEAFRAPLTDTAWMETRLESLSTALLAGSLAPDERAIPSSRVIEIQGMRFARVPGGAYILGYPLRGADDQGVPVEFEEPYWLQDRELTRSDFARFAQAEPRWAPENRRELVDQGLVQPEYLADWPDDWNSAFATGTAGTEPLRYVSWYAVEAFVNWANAGESVRVPGMERGRIVLPSAAQWEYAAFLNGLGGPSVVSDGGRPEVVGLRRSGALNIYDLEGNLWEWTSDWYASHARTIAPTTGDQRTVAGGSFATGETGHNLMGAQPPDWTTPFLGARLAIVQEESEVDTNGR